MKFRLRYMVDPGDGIVTTVEFEDATDDLGAALCNWHNDHNLYGYWVIGIEVLPK